jgi:hypothetical protein
MRGCLEGPNSNLGRRYIIVRLAVCSSTSGNKLELVLVMWELWVGGGGVQLEELKRVRLTPKPLPLPSQDIVM